eukprot:6312551-Pyramimonas_sp.AAC.1
MTDALNDPTPRHPNQYDPMVVLLNSWRQIGKSSTCRAGIDGTHRELSMLSVSASVIKSRQSRFVSDELARIEGCPVFCSFYDTTPVRLGFGRAQDAVMPHALYSVPDPENVGRWKLVRY